jgi:glycosyltransferase involved in cell wall biosynthesis
MMGDSSAPITVVIPAYHASSTIRRAVESALSQNGGGTRVIVVIDGADRETEEDLAAVADERLSWVVNHTNLGAPASRNRGLQLVSSPYVMFLDADDHFEGDLIGPLVARMSAEGAVLGFGPSLQWSPANGYNRLFVPDYRDHEDVFLRWFGGTANVQTAGVAWSSDYLRRIGGWDETIRRNQDGELALRAILLGARFICSEEGAAVWCNDAGSDRITTRTDNLAAMFDVVDKLESIHSSVVGMSTRLEAHSRQLLMIAHMAYRSGEDEVGHEALRRRQAMNAPARGQNARHRLSVFLRFVPRKLRRPLWAAVDKLHETLIANSSNSWSIKRHLENP